MAAKKVPFTGLTVKKLRRKSGAKRPKPSNPKGAYGKPTDLRQH
jgi:hypothetical protein